MTLHSEILILGGGVIGCAIARELSQAGHEVLILERGEPAREASWAAAGALIARAQSSDPDAALSLKLKSLPLFKELCASLQEETGIDSGFRETGGIDFFLTEEEIQEIPEFLSWQKSFGIQVEPLSEQELHDLEPHLTPDIVAGAYLPEFTQVRTPWFTRALLTSALKAGTRLETHTEVKDFIQEGDRVVGVRTDREEVFGGTTILAAGPWSPALARLLGKEIPGVPVKGQIILLNDRRCPVRHIVHHGKTYITPRDEGRLVVGSTEEWVGFQRENTLAGILGLLTHSREFYPCLEKASVESVWHGFRPLTIDGVPYLGGLSGLEGLLCATGHYRSGIILAPITARILAAMVEGRECGIDLAPYSPNRIASMESIDMAPRTDLH
jgi:glycine oxidase